MTRAFATVLSVACLLVLLGGPASAHSKVGYNFLTFDVVEVNGELEGQGQIRVMNSRPEKQRLRCTLVLNIYDSASGGPVERTTTFSVSLPPGSAADPSEKIPTYRVVEDIRDTMTSASGRITHCHRR